jgi:hypothetical protein
MNVFKVTRNRISVKTRFAHLYTAQPQDRQNEILACTSRWCLEVNQTRVMRGRLIAQATKSRSYIKLYKFDVLLHGTWRSITQNISWRGPWFILRHYAFCQLFQLERYKPSHNLAREIFKLKSRSESTGTIDYDGVRLCLRTAAANGPIVHLLCDMWAWNAMVVMMPAGDNSWLVHQSSLAVPPAETSGESRRSGRRSENFTNQYLKYLKGSLTYRKILRQGTSGFISRTKEDVLRFFIALKNPSPFQVRTRNVWVHLASTLTTTPPRRLHY